MDRFKAPSNVSAWTVRGRGTCSHPSSPYTAALNLKPLNPETLYLKPLNPQNPEPEAPKPRNPIPEAPRPRSLPFSAGKIQSRVAGPCLFGEALGALFRGSGFRV